MISGNKEGSEGTFAAWKPKAANVPFKLNKVLGETKVDSNWLTGKSRKPALWRGVYSKFEVYLLPNLPLESSSVRWIGNWHGMIKSKSWYNDAHSHFALQVTARQ